MFRERAAQQEIARFVAQHQNKYRQTEVSLLDKMMYEQGRKHDEQAAVEAAKRSEKEYLKTMSRDQVDAKRAEYMRSRTVGGKVREKKYII